MVKHYLFFIFLTLTGIYSCGESSHYQAYNHLNEETLVTKAPTVELYYSDLISHEIDSLFQNHLLNGEFVGAGISIVLNDHAVYENTFGIADAKNQKTLSNNSAFRIGSLSKSFTGVLCAILNQEGSLDYQEKISDLLPDFSLSNSDYDSMITVEHLLSHTGGFPYHSYTNLVEDGLKMGKIIPYFSKIKNLNAPGTIYSYQNAAFAILGSYLEVKYNQTISSLFSEKLFHPLGMNHSSSSHKALTSMNEIAYPHRQTKKGWSRSRLNKKYYNAVPAGGINTSTSDLSEFLNLLLGNHPEILNDDQIDRMSQPLIRTKVSYRYYKKWPGFENTFYGHGWRIHHFQSSDSTTMDKLVHHGGLVNGYRSEMAFNQDEEFAIAVVFNCNTPLAKNIIPQIISIIRKHKKSPLPRQESS